MCLFIIVFKFFRSDTEKWEKKTFKVFGCQSHRFISRRDVCWVFKLACYDYLYICLYQVVNSKWIWWSAQYFWRLAKICVNVNIFQNGRISHWRTIYFTFLADKITASKTIVCTKNILKWYLRMSTIDIWQDLWKLCITDNDDKGF